MLSVLAIVKDEKRGIKPNFGLIGPNLINDPCFLSWKKWNTNTEKMDHYSSLALLGLTFTSCPPPLLLLWQVALISGKGKTHYVVFINYQLDISN